MKRTVFVSGLLVGMLLISGSAIAQSKKKKTGVRPRSYYSTGKFGRTSEVSLVGISLYSSGQSVIAKYGSPNQIEAVTIGGSGAAGGGASGGGAPGGAPGMPGGGAGRRGGGGGGGAASPSLESDIPLPGFIGDPFGNSATARQMAPGDDPAAGQRGMPPGVPGAPSGAGPSGAGAPNSTQAAVQYTRWVYNRPSARYAFILDKYNKVVQIEAIGMNDPNVRTNRGIGFGNNFAQLMNRYFEPDGYEVSGDAFTVRFLQRGKVAFKFSRLDPKKPQVVTGIVVAAGKA